MALLLGTTAPEMMLFPYRREPDTGSRIPSISTGGAAMNAMMKQVVAASRQGIISVPNQPTYSRLLVEVTHWQKFSQVELRRCESVEKVVIKIRVHVSVVGK